MTRVRFSDVPADSLKKLIRDHDVIAAYESSSAPTPKWTAPRGESAPEAKILEVVTTSAKQLTALQNIVRECKELEPLVKLGIGGYTDNDTNDRGVRIEVTNVGDAPIHEIKVEWVYEFETPQLVEGKATGLTFHEIGRRFGFAPARSESERPLAIGKSRTYLLPPDWTRDMCSVVQSLSPEHYSIKITMDGKEETGIPGPAWGDFIQRHFDATSKATRFPFPPERMAFVQNLVGRIVELSRGYKVFPPHEITDDPSILESDEIVDRLIDTKWWLKFADGSEEVLSLAELVVLTYNVAAIKMQLDQAFENGFKSGDIKLNFSFAIEQLMTPEGVKIILSKIDFEGLPRRGIEEIKPALQSPTIHLYARKYLDSETNEPGVYLEVTNKGTTPIRQLNIEWVYGCDPPKRFRFVLQEGEVERPLEPGEMRLYVFPSERTKEMCSVVQSVSADMYSVQATKDGFEDTAIPGNEWGKFIETIFEK